MTWTLRTVLRRAGSQRLLVLVVAIVTVTACALLATLAVLSVSTERWATNKALRDLPADQTRLLVNTDVTGVSLTPARETVIDELDAVFADLDYTLEERYNSPIHTRAREEGLAALVYFSAIPDVAEHVEVLDGELPTGSADELRVAIPEPAAEMLDAGVGDEIPVSAASYGSSATARVVGVYRVVDPSDDFWVPDVLDGRMSDPAYPFPGSAGNLFSDAYGPFLTPAEAFVDELVMTSSARWYVVPDFTEFDSARLTDLRGTVDGVNRRLVTAIGDSGSFTYTRSELPRSLALVHQYLVVTRSGVVLGVLQLGLLALAALLLTARLVTERRSTEQALMRARGASNTQLAALALVEALIVGVVAALAAPPLARVVYLAVANRPAFASADIARDPGMPPIAWAVGIVAALVFAFVLVAPSLRKARTFVEQEQEHGRPGKRGIIQRAGVDVALLLLAVIGYWQLRQYQSPVVSQGAGLRVDPILIAGPALGLLAGALLLLRLLPLVARGAELVASRGRGLTAALAGWQVGRRPRRSAGSVLLLTLAIAVGSFSVSYLSTWQKSQQDQADFRTGTDVRITDLDARPLALARRIDGLSADTAGAPVVRRVAAVGAGIDFEGRISGASRDVALLAGDPEELGGVMRVRDDVLDASPAELLASLASDDAARGAIELPGEPDRIVLDMTAHLQEGALEGPTGSVVLQLRVEDAAGVAAPVISGPVRVDGERRTVTLPLRRLTGGAPAAYPLKVTAMSARYALPADAEQSPDPIFDLVTVDLHEIAVATGGDAEPQPVTMPDLEWTGDALQPFLDSRGLEFVRLREVTSDADSMLVFSTETPRTVAARGGVPTVLWPGERLEQMPVVVDQALASLLEVQAGTRFFMDVEGTTYGLVVERVLPHIPGLPDSDDGGMVADAGTLNRLLEQRGVFASLVDEWWLAVPDDRIDDVAAAAESAGLGAVDTRLALGDTLIQQPLRVGIQGALLLTAVAAALFAAVGFAMHATVVIRARRTEFAQLRAVGLSRRTLTGVVVVEYVLLALIGVGGGVLLGIALAWLVGPLVALSAEGSSPVPPVLVSVPWSDIALITGQMLALLALIVGAVALTMRGTRVGNLLRAGEER